MRPRNAVIAAICRSIRSDIALSSGSKFSKPFVSFITFSLIFIIAIERAIFSSMVT